jgi:hypothetical protein
MPTIGPTLPPHLSKRKRDDDDDEESRSPSPDTGDKKRRVIGPTLPPAPLDELPIEEPKKTSESEDSEDSDDDFGPALPDADNQPVETAQVEVVTSVAEKPVKSGRDEWMLAPPTSDRNPRIDPTKMKSRGFVTGPRSSVATGASGQSNLWTETPEEKRKRLQDEMMGVKKVEKQEPKKKDIKTEEMEKKIKKYNVSSQSESSYN